MELGLVRRIDIDSEMQQAYLDYAMSVIVARALPDARDGLKPVHRRILYAMYDMGIRSDTPYKKSARIVGEVLGKYHPHGDMAVYEAMARMAQDFSMRCLLVDGQGNFGSVDGDPPAAMRYTEARLAAPALHMLADIHKNTVDFDANFDDTLSEPSVLPSAIPNLLVNGATGIAVGMSTSIPPHNLGEVVDALKHLLENWERMDDIGLEDLMHFIPGPDFPTGGVIIQDGAEDSLGTAYGSGRGRVTVQARAHLEEMERGRNRIIVTELPFMTNKAALIERIAELARESKLEGLADLRDESDRQGMRIVIELVKTADPEAVLRDLYKHTPMQSTFSLIMLALVDGEPRLLTLKQALRVYLDHRQAVIRRRSQYDLEKARQRAHILEGLRIALKNLDEVIDMIRKAADAEAARARLMKRFKLSELQAQAILDMQLRRLAALERRKIEDEYKEMQALIKELEGLLRSPKKMRQTAADELQAVKDAYGDRRRTQIVRVKEGEEKRSMLTIEDLAPEKTAWLVVTPGGLVSRTLEDKMPRQSGSEAPAWLLRVNTRDTLYLASERGETAAVPVHAIPETGSPTEGLPYAKISALEESDKLAALFTLPPKGERPEGWCVLTLTRQGMVKKTAVSELPGPSAYTFTLVKVNEGDRLGWLRLTDGENEVLLVTAQGMAIRFGEDEVRPMGLVAAGVMALKLGKTDEVAGMELLPQPGDVFMIASDGSAKRVAAAQFPRQGRYGQGVVGWKLPPKVSLIGIAVGRGTARVTLHLSKMAPRMVRLDEASLQTRAARGGKIKDLKAGEQVLGLTAPWDMGRTPMEVQVEEIKKPRRARAELDEEAVQQVTFEQVMAQTSKAPRAQHRKPKTTEVIAIKPTRRPRAAAKADPVQMTLQPVVIPPQEKAKPAAPRRAATETNPPESVSTMPAAAAATKAARAKVPAKSIPSKPASTKPAPVKPASTKPALIKPASAKPAAVKPAGSKTTARKAPARSAPAKTAKTSTAKPGTSRAATKKAALAKTAPVGRPGRKPVAQATRRTTAVKPGTAKAGTRKPPSVAGLATTSTRKTSAKGTTKKLPVQSGSVKTTTKKTPAKSGSAKATTKRQSSKKGK